MIASLLGWGIGRVSEAQDEEQEHMKSLSPKLSSLVNVPSVDGLDADHTAGETDAHPSALWPEVAVRGKSWTGMGSDGHILSSASVIIWIRRGDRGSGVPLRSLPIPSSIPYDRTLLDGLVPVARLTGPFLSSVLLSPTFKRVRPAHSYLRANPHDVQRLPRVLHTD